MTENQIKNGPFKEYYEDGRLKEVGTIKNGDKEGAFSYFEYTDFVEAEQVDSEYLTINIAAVPAQEICTKGYYRKGLAEGTYQVFVNSVLSERGAYANGLGQGLFERFWLVGKRRFFLFPRKRAVGNYRKGRTHGIVREYDLNGLLSKELTFEDGIPVGVHKEYSGGSLEKEIPYVGGQMEGEVKTYFDDGTLRKKLTFSQGKKNGPYEEYRDDWEFGYMLEEKGFYRDDENTGLLKTLFPVQWELLVGYYWDNQILWI